MGEEVEVLTFPTPGVIEVDPADLMSFHVSVDRFVSAPFDHGALDGIVLVAIDRGCRTSGLLRHELDLCTSDQHGFV